VKLLNNLSQLILEAANLDAVQDSIRNKQVITINYDGREYGKGFRDIEPVCVGYSKKGELVLRAWERQGVSHSKVTKNNPIPGWRFFKLVKIVTYKPQGDNFYEMRPDYNPDGDKLMSSVILNAKFDDTQNIA
jgi:predicted DNA-binding transcriptional regulator YafY